MNRIKKYITPVIAGVVLLSLSSCAALPENRTTNSTNLSPTEPSNAPLTSQLDKATSKPAQTETQKSAPALSFNVPGSQATSTAQANTTSVNIYQADSQCQTLVPEKTAVPAETPVNAAIGKVLEKASSGDLDLAGYRVSIDPKTRIATVDLRLAPNSRRQFVSLSTCEQFALFGSLRKTLVDNGQLKIKDVRFTEQGQEIYL